MSPGANKRQTGTVPKTKTSRKNAVPQEMVAPTRRDLQQHLNDFFASVQRASKRDNSNRTPGENTCFELENFPLPENTRSCWPVRPIPRRTYVQNDVATDGQQSQISANAAAAAATLSATNAAIGVVIPTTPNTLHQHQNQLNEKLLHHNQQLLSIRVADSVSQQQQQQQHPQHVQQHQQQTRHVAGTFINDKPLPMEDRLAQIQDYIRITTSLIDSFNADKTNGARPQSVSSIHTHTPAPNTPTLEELQTKLESSNLNIMHIKEQQQQLLRVQQAAKNQLYEMEQIRNQQQPLTFAANNQNAPPDYDNVEDVTQDVASLMSRMKTLTDFIHSQSNLATSLDIDDKSDLMEEQTQLQKKLLDLKNKKQQMAHLVSELHAMNTQAENNFDDSNNSRSMATAAAAAAVASTTAPQNTPQHIHNDDESFEDHSLVKRLDNDKMADGAVDQQQQPNHSNALLNGEDDEDDEVAAAGSMIQYKIAEINAMKDQLKRLQDMMHTVKLIEIKNGDYQPMDDETEELAFNEKTQGNETANNMQQANDDPQHDVVEQEMAERVRVLHSMTNDLRQQAVTLAAERDRLKVIKNEMATRREFDSSEKNLLKQQQTHQQNHGQSPLQLSSTSGGGIVQKEHILDSNFMHKKLDADKLMSNEMQRANKECIQSDDSQLYSPTNNWPNRQNVSSSTPLTSSTSLRSSHGAGVEAGTQSEHLISKMNLINCNQGKESTDSGAVDMLNMSIEAASMQSCSSRGYSVPPTMRNITGREASWQKSSQEIPRSLNNQTNGGVYENQTEQNYPWYWHNYNQACSSATPQSPHCYHHHMCMPPIQTPSTVSNDPMLMQQFIQTQQMLINSISQCNQLLWDQQREINNLNSAVLLIQERLLNMPNNSMVDTSQQNMMRSESVPPNIVCPNQSPFLPRAQSEQPLNFPNFTPQPPSCGATMHQHQQQQQQPQPQPQPQPQSQQSPLPPSPYRQHPNAVSAAAAAAAQNAQYYRNNQQGVRLLRQPILNSRNGAAVVTTATAAVPYYESDPIQYSNNFLNAHNLSNHANENGANGPPPLPPNNATTINNLHQPNLTNASNSATPVINNSVNATNTVTALNNQVLPGIRANNFYDNFRSYSRQNLLSSGNSKSNEMEQTQAHITHNNLPLTIGNKFRNQINQNTPPDVLNVNQQRYYHDVFDNFSTNTNYNNLKVVGTGSSSSGAGGAAASSTSSSSSAINSMPPAGVASIIGASVSSAQGTSNANSTVTANANRESNLLNSIANNSNTNNENRCTDDQKSINSYNFDVNELKQPKMPLKTLQKGSTGGSKRVRPLRESVAPSNERDNQFVSSSPINNGNIGGTITQNVQDLNLASSSNQRSNSKSSATSKLFDDLKENVYLEVSALIEQNESRPHFLINLFRELQLISSSDPLRKRLMQAFQEVYMQHCELNASPNILSDMQVPVSNIQQQNDLENPHHQEVTEQHSNGSHFNERDGTNNLASMATCVPDLRSSIDEALLRTITVNSSDENETINACAYLDLTVKPDRQNTIMSGSKINESAPPTPLADVVAIEGNVPHNPCTHASTTMAMATTPTMSSSSSQYNQAPICLVAHLSSSINQDLAEADQSIENDVTNNENAASSPEMPNLSSEHSDQIPNNDISNEGAVGGLDSFSTLPEHLPDLAKVTANTSTPNNVTPNGGIDYADL